MLEKFHYALNINSVDCYNILCQSFSGLLYIPWHNSETVGSLPVTVISSYEHVFKTQVPDSSKVLLSNCSYVSESHLS